ncbi:unnamed protein product [Paramecium octaurelia]|uniref:Uncharacterized protein n=1 Tax=Paramecium octaurelia TaxID=43137 RepID=A0A8S1SAC1_PAROT|nr:unnamed protein product [Paramecium octaurelia]
MIFFIWFQKSFLYTIESKHLFTDCSVYQNKYIYFLSICDLFHKNIHQIYPMINNIQDYLFRISSDNSKQKLLAKHYRNGWPYDFHFHNRHKTDTIIILDSHFQSRGKDQPTQPFTLYDFQESLLLSIINYIEHISHAQILRVKIQTKL